MRQQDTQKDEPAAYRPAQPVLQVGDRIVDLHCQLVDAVGADDPEARYTRFAAAHGGSRLRLDLYLRRLPHGPCLGRAGSEAEGNRGNNNGDDQHALPEQCLIWMSSDFHHGQ